MTFFKKLAVLPMLIAAGPALAGGSLDTIKFTSPNFALVDVVPIQWDTRCSTVPYTLNTAALPNEVFGEDGEFALDIEAVETLMTEMLAEWNNIPTSFIELVIVDSRDTGNDVRGFDFINEITFSTAPGFGALASSPSTPLWADTDLPAGADVDGDGDSDVFDPAVEGVNTCQDINGDGDIEFPAGFYPAGTILDNDVQFSETVFWSLTPSPFAADIGAVAVHEFGHSHGLAHDLINQTSLTRKFGQTSRFGTTMFPFIDTSDPEEEVQIRQLNPDDIAWSSFKYPEGSDTTGNPALQPGDVAFDSAYSVIRGEIREQAETMEDKAEVTADSVAVKGISIGGPDFRGVLGAHVFATDTISGESEIGAYSGTARVVGSPEDCCFVVDPTVGIVNGNYELPVPQGAYTLAFQSPDVAGATGGNISTTAVLSGFYGQVGYDEEGIDNKFKESAFETRPGSARFLFVFPGFTQFSNVDGIVNESIQLQDFGAQDFGGTAAAVGFPGVVYAQRFGNEQVLAAFDGNSRRPRDDDQASLNGEIPPPPFNGGPVAAKPSMATFGISGFDSEGAPTFKRAALMLGRLDGNGNAQLESTVVEDIRFVGQDGDLSPLYFDLSSWQVNQLELELLMDPTLDLFVVLEALDNPPLSPGGNTPPLLALDDDDITGNSFFARDGSELAPIGFNWLIQLIFSESDGGGFSFF